MLSILAFAAFTNALGGALEEFWPVFGTKAGMTKAAIALFVGAQNGVEALSAMVAHRLAGWSNAAFYFFFVMAGALLGSIPVAIVYSFFVDNYVSGLTAGAVKG